MTESPSALLERAAAHLEKLAEHFESYERAAQDEPHRVGSPVTWWAYDTRDRNAPQAAQRWLETMSPAVATPLVAWMRNTARYLHYERGAVSSPERGREFFEGKYGGALEFARRVLGEHAEEGT